MNVRLTCTDCGQSIPFRASGVTVHCEQCGKMHPLMGHLCPACHSYSESETTICLRCGAATTRLCSNCNAANWSGAELCRQCSTSLDILEYVHGYTPDRHRERLRDQMQSAKYFKDIEEKGSQRRMAALHAIEVERQKELRQRLEEQEQRERRMALFAATVATMILLLVIVFTVWN